ncbi:hypothetical protein AVEN_133537-1 [Araneus ventricosus]|uniref:Uncharacterized protein n=1 Tax=Araneus ventricosus TaxID=182803 RepID=A0A4Y2IY19_ARAVE|nr:hypothetical protein AVEN_173338-1 [Araneus ventricosus]GBM82501.1 hypothetical protein AVEN_6578-1 [Araneus ventricosus]GBM82555.1 hypothetical protein AVEN_133537-1 [Araneus ventricosus]
MDLVILMRMTPELAPPLQTSAPHQREDVWPPYVGFNVQQAPYTTALQWNRVWNLDPSGTEADTLPLGHRGLKSSQIYFLYSQAHINHQKRNNYNKL